jgi:DNA repair ATPase RecN
MTIRGVRVGEETIEVTIGPDGKVEMHVTGVPGMDCLERTAELARLLGGEVEAQELTAEAYQDTAEQERDQLWH